MYQRALLVAGLLAAGAAAQPVAADLPAGDVATMIPRGLVEREPLRLSSLIQPSSTSAVAVPTDEPMSPGGGPDPEDPGNDTDDDTDNDTDDDGDDSDDDDSDDEGDSDPDTPDGGDDDDDTTTTTGEAAAPTAANTFLEPSFSVPSTLATVVTSAAHTPVHVTHVPPPVSTPTVFSLPSASSHSLGPPPRFSAVSFISPRPVRSRPAGQEPSSVSSASSGSATEPAGKPSPTGSTTGTTGTSNAPGAKASTYAEIVVAHHNLHRANHSAPALAWDDKLASTAQKIAASCNFAHNTQMDGGGYGQNIAAGTKPDNISAVITDGFYNGEVNYFANLYGQANPPMNNLGGSWGHFSQVVWKTTTKVGCYTMDCSAKKLGGVGQGVMPWFTVCNYGPPGNFGGEYAENVGKSLNKPTIGWSEGLSASAIKGDGITQ